MARAWVYGNKAIPVVTEPKWFSVHFNVVKFHAIHVLESDWVPLELTREFCEVDVPQSHFWLETEMLLKFIDHIEAKDIVV